MTIWIIFIGFMILSWVVSLVLKSKFKKYSKLPIDNGMTGKEVAERMLRDNGIYDVKIVSVQGHLTDHYNPADKTINLSQDVYNGRHISAAAVAALVIRTRNHKRRPKAALIDVAGSRLVNCFGEAVPSIRG